MRVVLVFFVFGWMVERLRDKGRGGLTLSARMRELVLRRRSSLLQLLLHRVL